jgi:acetyl-CoA synthetase
MTGAEAFRRARNTLLSLRNDYAGARVQFRWPELEFFNWALDYFDVEASGNDAPALWIVEEDGSEVKWSWRQMSQRSNQVANFLRGLGIQRGDPILVMLPNHTALWETVLASIKLGAVIIPATQLLSQDDVNDRISRGRVRCVIALASEESKFRPHVGTVTTISVGATLPGWTRYEDAYAMSTDLAPVGATHADDPLLLYFTSGTTAKPKLVLHTHQSYPVGHLSTMYWLGLQPDDIHYNISSPGWAKHAWSSFFAPWNAGATIFVFNYRRFDAAAVVKVLARCDVTSLCAPPTVWRSLVQLDLSAHHVRLRELASAGEPLNPEIIERVRLAWGLAIRDGFGQTETTAQIGNSPDQPLKPGSMGRPLPGYRIELLDPDGMPTDEGEITVALDPPPTGLMCRYADDDDKTIEVTRAGWYHTGDVAARDADGYYTYVGRADDVFKSSDYRISPFELESVLIEHPAVAESAVVPSPDPRRLAIPKAFVTLRAGYAPSQDLAGDILGFVKSRVSLFKRIRKLEFCELPKTISGKIRRAALRDLEVERAGVRSPGEYREEDFEGRLGHGTCS